MRTALSVQPLAPVFKQYGISHLDAARALNLPVSAVQRLARLGLLPRGRIADVCTGAAAYLRHRGVPADALSHLEAPVPYEPKKVDPATLQRGGVVPPEASQDKENEAMLLRNENITPQARKHFGLPRSPFVDDVQSREDVLLTQHGRYVRAALMDAARNHGFVAIIGQSGSGKSTLREELEERIRDEALPIVLIKPYVQGMEQSDARGRPLRAGHIAEAIVDALAPGLALKNSPQGRYKQVHELLKASRQAGYTHLLLIEEAHRLPIPTLKHLKSFLEMKDGLRRLIGVCLIGQNELFNILSERNPDVREIVQRCEQIAMEPLDNDVEAYLQLKLARVDKTLADVFEPGAVDAIRARLVHHINSSRSTDVVSICYPQVVNNLVSRALNAAAAVGFPKVDAQVIAGC